MVGAVPRAPAVPLLRWEGATRLGVEVAVTTREGGVSAAPYDSLNLALHVGDRPEDVAANRDRAAGAFGVDPATLVFARQVHGGRATVVGPSDAGRGRHREDDAVGDTDVLVTAVSDVTLVVLVADCVPLALVDPDVGVLAAIHAGWRGVCAGVVTSALRAMADLGARPERVAAFVGPAVAADRYQVSEDVHQALAGALPAGEDRAVVRPDGPGHWLVDLPGATRAQLRAGGVEPERITLCRATTAERRFFSDRAARPCGRQALLARVLG